MTFLDVKMSVAKIGQVNARFRKARKDKGSRFISWLCAGSSNSMDVSYGKLLPDARGFYRLYADHFGW